MGIDPKRVALILTALGAAVACGSSAADGPPPAATTPQFGGRDGGDDEPGDDCPDAAKDVFVISEQNDLYAFKPAALAFDKVGPLACDAGGATPSSMAVDRKGVAWVRHSDGSMWKVDTRTLACTQTAFAPDPASSFYKFGMGFVSTNKGSSEEALFLSDEKGAGLAELDTKSLEVAPVGTYDNSLEGQKSELTGTGDGKLFGLFVTEPVQIAEIDKTSGSILSRDVLDGVFAGNAWAFSAYAGSFYVYTHDPNSAGGSDVTRFSPKDDALEVVLPKVGFKIVGAGVSTCAPTEDVK